MTVGPFPYLLSLLPTVMSAQSLLNMQDWWNFPLQKHILLQKYNFVSHIKANKCRICQAKLSGVTTLECKERSYNSVPACHWFPSAETLIPTTTESSKCGEMNPVVIIIIFFK